MARLWGPIYRWITGNTQTSVTGVNAPEYEVPDYDEPDGYPFPPMADDSDYNPKTGLPYGWPDPTCTSGGPPTKKPVPPVKTLTVLGIRGRSVAEWLKCREDWRNFYAGVCLGAWVAGKLELPTYPPQRVLTIWFTGVPDSGKTTLARLLAKLVSDLGLAAKILDGNELRENLSPDLGFTPVDRDTHNRRVGYLARTLNDQGIISIVAVIAPHAAIRQEIRGQIENYIEVYVRCPEETLLARDTKGLYKKARAGELSNLTGYNAPYDIPENPEVTVDTDTQSPEACIEVLMHYLVAKGYLPSVRHRGGLRFEPGMGFRYTKEGCPVDLGECTTDKLFDMGEHMMKEQERRDEGFKL